MAAYNCGPGNVNKAIRRSGGLKDYWKIYDHLPRETRGYVPAFIAVNYVFAHAADHNLYPVVPIIARIKWTPCRCATRWTWRNVAATHG